MQRGFTVIELITIIVVIAILATLSTFAYRGWRQDTIKRAIASDLRAAASSMEQEKNFSDDPSAPYPNKLPASFKSNSTNISVYIQNHGKDFCLEGASGNPALKYHIRNQRDEVNAGGCT